MAKIHYPENGIYTICSKELNELNECLSKAKNINYLVPAGFKYFGYIQRLPSVIRKMSNLSESINCRMVDVEKRYNNLTEELEEKNNTIDEYEVKERENLVEEY